MDEVTGPSQARPSFRKLQCTMDMLVSGDDVASETLPTHFEGLSDDAQLERFAICSFGSRTIVVSS